MSLACIHSSLQLRTCLGVSLRRSLSCTYTPQSLSLLFFSVDRNCLVSGDREKHRLSSRSPVIHDSFITTSNMGHICNNFGCQRRTLAHFLVSSHRRQFGFRFSFAGTASRSEGKYCRRRIRVEDDDASVTNFIPRDWRQFHCDNALS